ncbi:hypothetical protein [Dyadobacter tibetensis]|uniref:hypothetical protein n=1 Tax=Dyadobacter tibetensis TaxID=1211851 RepID=UPI00046EFC90|nr:hypothetical protein [Dyadobacter tibetensis]
MKNFIFPPVLLALLTFSGCAPKKDANTLIQAHKLHLESIAIAQELESTFQTLQKRNLPTAHRQKVDSLNQLLHLWEASLIEVSGFDHEHEGAHEHKPAPQMTEESMLEYQLQAKQAILLIQKDLEEFSQLK